MLAFYLSLALTDDDSEIIEKLYNAYYPVMIFVAKKSLGNMEGYAEDIVHDAMLRIIERIDSLDTSDFVKTKNLCVTIVKNLCYNHLHAAKFSNDSIEKEENIESAVFLEEIVVSEENIRIIENAIDSLSEKYRLICSLKFVQGYKDSEIAALLSMNPSTVRSRIERARNILKKKLKERDKNE